MAYLCNLYSTQQTVALLCSIYKYLSQQVSQIYKNLFVWGFFPQSKMCFNSETLSNLHGLFVFQTSADTLLVDILLKLCVLLLLRSAEHNDFVYQQMWMLWPCIQRVVSDVSMQDCSSCDFYDAAWILKEKIKERNQSKQLVSQCYFS